MCASPKTSFVGTLQEGLPQDLEGAGGDPQITCDRIPGLDTGPLVQDLEAQHAKFSGSIPSGNLWTGVLISWGPLLLLFVIYFVAMQRMQKGGGGPLSFGRNRAKIHDASESVRYQFTDVAGVEEAKGELRRSLTS